MAVGQIANNTHCKNLPYYKTFKNCFGNEENHTTRGFMIWERAHLEDLGIDVRILNWVFKKLGEGARNGLIWLRIGRHGGIL